MSHLSISHFRPELFSIRPARFPGMAAQFSFLQNSQAYEKNRKRGDDSVLQDEFSGYPFGIQIRKISGMDHEAV